MLKATTEAILELGLHALTFDEVTRRSGVAKTTIYRHFPTKNALIVAALDGVTPVPITPDTGSLRQDLIEFLESVRPIFADPTVRKIMADVQSAALRDKELRTLQTKMLAGRAGPTLTIYERARERGELRDEIDYLTAVEIIEGPFIVRSLARPQALKDVDIEELVDRILVQLTP